MTLKLKRLKVPKYIFRDRLGEFEINDVEILLDVESTITADTFDQNKDTYYISSKEIDKHYEESNDSRRTIRNC